MISVIVPTYNEGRQPAALLESLEGIAGLTEILFVDASDDELSRRIVHELPTGNSVRVISAMVRGRAAQMNQGARRANGRVLLFLHCDTTLPRDAVLQMEGVLQYRKWGRFDLQLDAPGWPFRLIEFMVNLRSRLTRIATGDQAIFVLRDFFLAQGGFADIELMEDIEFSRRVGRRYRPGRVASPVRTSARRWIRQGVAQTIGRMWVLRLLYRLGVQPERLARMYPTAR